MGFTKVLVGIAWVLVGFTKVLVGFTKVLAGFAHDSASRMHAFVNLLAVRAQGMINTRRRELLLCWC